MRLQFLPPPPWRPSFGRQEEQRRSGSPTIPITPTDHFPPTISHCHLFACPHRRHQSSSCVQSSLLSSSSTTNPKTAATTPHSLRTGYANDDGKELNEEAPLMRLKRRRKHDNLPLEPCSTHHHLLSSPLKPPEHHYGWSHSGRGILHHHHHHQHQQCHQPRHTSSVLFATMPHYLLFFTCFYAIALLSLLNTAVTAEQILNLRPRQFVNEATSRPRFRPDDATKVGTTTGSAEQAAAAATSSRTKGNLLRLIGGLYPATDSLLIGGRNALYNLSASSLELRYAIRWKALAQTTSECILKGKPASECDNFIRVATPLGLDNGDRRQLVCGTHAYSPQCRVYELVSSGGGGGGGGDEPRFVEREQFNGQAISPYEPRHNSTFYYNSVDNELFAGTVADIGGNDPLIYKTKLPRGDNLRTTKNDRVLDVPDFVGSFARNGYVYFFFREPAAELRDSTNGGAGARGEHGVLYSRVARVCASEVGGPSPVQERWTTFLKARLNCSLPGRVDSRERGDGASAFYFNEIQSISELVDLDGTPTTKSTSSSHLSGGKSDGGGGDALVYALFHTPRSLLMSAVCAFRLSAIDAVFDHGRFHSQPRPGHGAWGPKFLASHERPGKCNSGGIGGGGVPTNPTVAANNEQLAVAVAKNPLMWESVGAEGQRPLLVDGPGRAELLSLAAMPRVRSVRESQRHDVLFVGRADGTLLKAVVVEPPLANPHSTATHHHLPTSPTSAGMGSSSGPTALVELVRVFPAPSPTAISTVRVVVPSTRSGGGGGGGGDGGSGALIVISDEEVVRLPVQHCSLQKTCASCVRLRDPHCAWDVDVRKCVHKRDWSRGSYVQNIPRGFSEQCPDSNFALLQASSSYSSTHSDHGADSAELFSIDEESMADGSSAIGYGPNPLPVQFSDAYSAAESQHHGSEGGGMEMMTGGLSLLALAVIIALVGGLVAGYRLSQWRLIQRTKRTSAGSSNGSEGSNGLNGGGGIGSSSSQGSSDYADGGGYTPSRRRQPSVLLHGSTNRLDALAHAPSLYGQPAVLLPHHQAGLMMAAMPPPSSAGSIIHHGGSGSSAAAGDSVSLVFPPPHVVYPHHTLQMVPHHHQPHSGAQTPSHLSRHCCAAGATTMSMSNGGSGMQTPRHLDARSAIGLGGPMGQPYTLATLPRDYKVKKVYL